MLSLYLARARQCVGKTRKPSVKRGIKTRNPEGHFWRREANGEGFNWQQESWRIWLQCKLLEAQRRWHSWECMEKMGAEPVFSKCFNSCVAESMREGMISSVRKAAWIGENLYLTTLQNLFTSNTSYRLSRIAMMKLYLGNQFWRVLYPRPQMNM